MFVDIHTHTTTNTRYPTIRNLSIPDGDTFFSTTLKEYVSVGIHPWHADNFMEKQLVNIEKWSADQRLVAIGECGLDKNSKASIEKQLLAFSKQIELSERIQKPLIIHCVGHFNELFELKKTIKPQQLWIIHGFRGKPELAKQLIKSGCALSFGEHFNPESVHITPFEKLFVETDESNLPIEEIYDRIASIKNCTPKHISAGWVLLQQVLSPKT